MIAGLNPLFFRVGFFQVVWSIFDISPHSCDILKHALWFRGLFISIDKENLFLAINFQRNLGNYGLTLAHMYTVQ